MSEASRHENVLIQLDQVALGYEKQPILTGVRLAILPGETLAMVGPNGAGKSTLLYTMLGMLPPISGRVVRRARLVVGFVPQRGRHDAIFSFRATDVVAMGGMGIGRGGRWPRTRFATRQEVNQVLGELGVAELGQRTFSDLSGGQQQRVLIARALVRKPELLVLDEPTAGMDLPAERDLLDLVVRLAATRGMAVVFVTHQLSLAAQYAARIALMSKDQGIFAVDDTNALLTSERLTALYNRGMEVIAVNDVQIVRAVAPVHPG